MDDQIRILLVGLSLFIAEGKSKTRANVTVMASLRAGQMSDT